MSVDKSSDAEENAELKQEEEQRDVTIKDKSVEAAIASGVGAVSKPKCGFGLC